MRSRSSRVANSTSTSPAARAHRDLHPGVEVVAEQLLELEQARRPQPASRRPSPRLGRGVGVGSAPSVVLADRLLDRADREVLGDGPLGELLLERAVGRAEQRAGVAHRSVPLLEEPLDRRRELQEPQGVRDRGAALADPGRDVVVGEREVLDELLVGRRLLERVELLALDVLDDRLLRASTRRRRRGRSPGSSGARPGAPRASGARPRSARTPSPTGRTRTGWSTPTSRIDSASGASASSSKCSRGWCGFGRIDAIGISSSPPMLGVETPSPSGSAHRDLYPVRRVAPRLTSFASSRYAIAPRDVESNTMIG